MLALNLRRIYCVCNKVIIRNIRNRRSNEVHAANPGLQKRINVFQQDGIKIDDEDAEEFIDQSDSDFYNVSKSHKYLEKEKVTASHMLRQNIVKERYFKENMPNLLTWSEKEQIRHLASSEPGEWTPEKIAESFPITVPVVKKLLKYPWKPATEERIARHDASAMRNWKELKEGTLDIPEDLMQHFLKFSERTIPPLNKQSLKIDINPGNNIGEFESIIRRCAAKEASCNEAQENRKNGNISSVDETALIKVNQDKNIKDNNRITLEELQEKVKKRLSKGREINANDQIMLNTITAQETETKMESSLNKEIELHEHDKNEKQVSIFKDNSENEKDIMEYPLRIRVPKKAYKKDATYKVNDCYYDHDGVFLYRVLGMSK